MISSVLNNMLMVMLLESEVNYIRFIKKYRHRIDVVLNYDISAQLCPEICILLRRPDISQVRQARHSKVQILHHLSGL